MSETQPLKKTSYIYDAADRLLSAGSDAFTYDANGNEILKTAGRRGQPILYAYDAANRLIGATGSTFASSFAYDDPGTQLYYLRARYYDPSVGRFLTKDSFFGLIQDPRTANAYIYALDDPTELSDRSGRFVWFLPLAQTGTGAVLGPVTNALDGLIPNAGRNPTSLKAFLTGLETQKEVFSQFLEQFIQRVVTGLLAPNTASAAGATPKVN